MRVPRESAAQCIAGTGGGGLWLNGLHKSYEKGGDQHPDINCPHPPDSAFQVPFQIPWRKGGIHWACPLPNAKPSGFVFCHKIKGPRWGLWHRRIRESTLMRGDNIPCSNTIRAPSGIQKHRPMQEVHSNGL